MPTAFLHRRATWFVAVGIFLTLALMLLDTPRKRTPVLDRAAKEHAGLLAREAKDVVERTHGSGFPWEDHPEDRARYDSFGEVIAALVWTDQLKEARALADRMEREQGWLRVAVDAEIAAVLALAGKVTAARELARSSDRIDVDSFIEIAGWLATDGHVSEALRLSRIVLSGRTRDMALVRIVQVLSTQGRIHRGRRVAAAISSRDQKVVALASLAVAAAEVNRRKEADAILVDALGLLKGTGDIDESRSALVSAIAFHRTAQEAIDFAGGIMDADRRNLALFEAYKKLVQNSETAKAETLQRHAAQFKLGSTEGEKTYTCASEAVPSAYSEARLATDEKGVRGAASSVIDPGRRIITFSCLSSLFAREGKIRESRLALTIAMEAAAAMEPRKSSLEELAVGGPPTLDPFDFLIEAIVSVLDTDSLREVAKRLPYGTDRRAALVRGAVALWKAGKRQEASALVDEAWQTSGPSRGDTRTRILTEASVTDFEFIATLAFGGMAEKAGKVAREVYHGLSSASAIVTTLRREGRFQEAFELEQAATKLDPPDPAVKHIQTLTSAGRLDEAERQVAGIQDRELRQLGSLIVVAGLIRTDRLDQAVALARRVDGSPAKAALLARAAIRYVRGVPIHLPDRSSR